MPKSEVLIEMPEFEKKYNLAMVEAEKVASRVRPKQFLHIDESECILCEGCVDICPWKCIHYLSVDAIEDSINVESPDASEEPGFFVVDEDAHWEQIRVCIALIDATASVFIANYHLNRIGVVYILRCKLVQAK